MSLPIGKTRFVGGPLIPLGVLMTFGGIPLIAYGAVQEPINWLMVGGGGAVSIIGVIVLAAKLGLFTILFEMLGGLLDALLLIRWPLRRANKSEEESPFAR